MHRPVLAVTALLGLLTITGCTARPPGTDAGTRGADAAVPTRAVALRESAREASDRGGDGFGEDAIATRAGVATPVRPVFEAITRPIEVRPAPEPRFFEPPSGGGRYSGIELDPIRTGGISMPRFDRTELSIPPDVEEPAVVEPPAAPSNGPATPEPDVAGGTPPAGGPADPAPTGAAVASDPVAEQAGGELF
ncbi:hypothetical protein [Jannaschia sp. LMIT008]|uniref:hypothetical protein n=1 Tax=Jannaschia maritima TaxID=3032585 RepID=UPI002811CB9F|nr:hypothetical protein [Jannaschia sp. LMIT008]